MPRITDNTIIRKRIDEVRNIMKKNSTDLYIVFTGDYHLSEYAGDYFGEREFLSGFTGSAGTLVIGMDKAALFTDGRYFVQAELQLKGTGIELMRIGVKDVPELTEYCIQNTPANGSIAVDGRTISASFGEKLEHKATKKNIKLDVTVDYAKSIWNNRPDFPYSKAFVSDNGETVREKLIRLREKINEKEAGGHIITSLDDICWLFNIRGNDVVYNPVIMSYAYVTDKCAYLFADKDRFSDEIIEKLQKDGVTLKPYEEFYDFLDTIEEKVILVDMKRINYCAYKKICNCGVETVKTLSPVTSMKAVKNPVEIKNLSDVHIEDGLALTRFMFWVKENAGKGITEKDAADYLDNERAKISNFIELSFETISAYGANAAMMHYSATKDNCAMLKPEGMLLVDSGGQYMRGTTDVTRTIVLGPVSDEIKKAYTLTLKGMLALADARFLYGCTGFNLDILARGSLWEAGLDYRCGTGHGVGYLLNVHESPNGFRWKHILGQNDLCVMEPGMVTSDEPGVYVDGKYGIRIENEIVCVRDYENEYGTFLKFKMLTCAPIDLEAVDVSYLNEKDIERINNYHSWVYEQLSPYMCGEELEKLKRATVRI